MRTFVSCETTTEANQQRIRINLIHQRNDTWRISLVLQPCITEWFADIINQLILHRHTSLPDFFIGHVIDSFPNLRIRLVKPEVFVEIFKVQLFPFCCTPSREVNTVSNITYVHFFREIPLPNSGEHFLRNFSVEPAHTVHFLRSVASKNRHTETFTLVTRIITSEIHQVVPANTHSGRITSHIFTKQSFIKIVVTCRNRSMNSIKRRSTNQLDSLIECQSRSYIVTDTLNIN